MYSQMWPLQKAYDYLRIKRPIISPNLGFMGALKGLEKEFHIPEEAIHAAAMASAAATP